MFGLTEVKEREFKAEADAKIESLEDEINDLEERLLLKRNALSYWHRRLRMLNSAIRARARRAKKEGAS